MGQGKLYDLAYSGYYNDGSNFYDKVEIRPNKFTRLQLGRRDRGDKIKGDTAAIQFTYSLWHENDNYGLKRKWQGENVFGNEFESDSSNEGYVSDTTFNESRSVFAGRIRVFINSEGGYFQSLDRNVRWSLRHMSELTDVQLWDRDIREEEYSVEMMAHRFGFMLNHLGKVEERIKFEHSGENDFVTLGS